MLWPKICLRAKFEEPYKTPLYYSRLLQIRKYFPIFFNVVLLKENIEQTSVWANYGKLETTWRVWAD